jgi:hypothetical protein
MTMKKLLAIAALATVGFTGAAQAGGFGYGYSYGPSYGYFEAPVYRYYRPRYVKRFFAKRHFAPVYGYYGYY